MLVRIYYRIQVLVGGEFKKLGDCFWIVLLERQCNLMIEYFNKFFFWKGKLVEGRSCNW